MWITYGWYYDRNWWKAKNVGYDSCSSGEIGQALHGSVSLSHLPVSETDDRPTNVCVQHCSDVYSQHRFYSFQLTGYYHKLVYDAVMVYGISLNATKLDPETTPAEALRNLNTTGLTVGDS